MTDAGNLLEIRGDDNHGASLGQALHQHGIDLGLCADVDAERRLLEHEQATAELYPACKDQLLLVAAAEHGYYHGRIRRPYVEILEEIESPLPLGARPEQRRANAVANSRIEK